VESVIDELAERLEAELIDLRLHNAAREGVQAPYGPKFRAIGNSTSAVPCQRSPTELARTSETTRFSGVFQRFGGSTELTSPKSTVLLTANAEACTHPPPEWTHPKGTQMAKKQEYGKALSKTETLNTLAEKTGLSKKEVGSVIDALGETIGEQLNKKGPGVFNVPGLMKVKVVRKPAVPARKGINPFTKEEPARNVVKITPLKALKDAV